MLKFRTILLAAAVVATGCDKAADSQPLAHSNAARFSEQFRAPKTLDDTLAASRFIAANATVLPLEGELSPFHGSLADASTRHAVQEKSDIRDNFAWVKVMSLAGTEAVHHQGFGLRSAVGDFVLYEVTSPGNRLTYMVGVSLADGKSAIYSAQGNVIEPAGDLHTVAATLAGTAFSKVADAEQLAGAPSATGPLHKAMALGYLYYLQEFVANSSHKSAPANVANAPDSTATSASEATLGATTAPVVIDVADPSRLMLQHSRYQNKVVRFVVRSQGSLSAHPIAAGYLRIDEYPDIAALFDGAAVERWISEGFNKSYNSLIVITGRVRPDKWGTNVVVDVMGVRYL